MEILWVRENTSSVGVYCNDPLGTRWPRFFRYGVPLQAEVVEQGPDAPWLELHELVDLDDRIRGVNLSARPI